MASGPITSWQIDGETMETVTDLGYHCSWAPKLLAMKLKDACFLERKLMTNLDNILKSRDTTLPTKIHIVKVMVFLVVMYRCENWTMKKTECQRTNAFKLWCWRRFLRVLWNARRSTSQSYINLNIHWKD